MYYIKLYTDYIKCWAKNECVCMLLVHHHHHHLFAKNTYNTTCKKNK